MGTLTRQLLRESVEDNLGGRKDISTRINTYLDHAQLRIARSYNFKELEKVDEVTFTPVGTPATDKRYTHGISKLRDFHSLIRRVGSETPVKLTRLFQYEWDRLIRLPEATTGSTQDPKFYNMWENTVEWWPVPTRAFQLHRRYTFWPTDFTADGVASDLDNKDDMIIALATHIAFQSLGQREDASVYFAIYTDMLDKAIKEDTQRPDLARIPRGVTEDGGLLVDPVTDPFVRRID